MVIHLMSVISNYLEVDTRNGKFDSKGDEGIFLGYSSKRKAYNFFNKTTNTVI